MESYSKIADFEHLEHAAANSSQSIKRKIECSWRDLAVKSKVVFYSEDLDIFGDGSFPPPLCGLRGTLSDLPVYEEILPTPSAIPNPVVPSAHASIAAWATDFPLDEVSGNFFAYRTDVPCVNSYGPRERQTPVNRVCPRITGTPICIYM